MRTLRCLVEIKCRISTTLLALQTCQAVLSLSDDFSLGLFDLPLCFGQAWLYFLDSSSIAMTEILKHKRKGVVPKSSGKTEKAVTIFIYKQWLPNTLQSNAQEERTMAER